MIMTKLRGTPQTVGKTWKQDLIKSNVYNGIINRDYEKLQRFSIAYPGEIPYQVNSKKTLEQLQNIHEGAVVTVK